MPTLELKFSVGGVLTDATSAVLSDPTDTYGVKRIDTGTTVVANNAAMAHVATGIYRYTFAAPAVNLTYSWWAEVVFNGATYRFEKELADGESAPSVTAAEMVTKIKTALRDSPAGVVSITVDGQTVAYSRKQAMDELKFWQTEAATESKTRPRAATILLDSF